MEILKFVPDVFAVHFDSAVEDIPLGYEGGVSAKLAFFTYSSDVSSEQSDSFQNLVVV